MLSYFMQPSIAGAPNGIPLCRRQRLPGGPAFLDCCYGPASSLQAGIWHTTSHITKGGPSMFFFAFSDYFPALKPFISWCADTAIGQYIHTVTWAFPLI